MALSCILWPYRDGSIHIQVKYASFFDERGMLERHLDGEKSHIFETACGLAWWNKASSSGYGDSETISCVSCRAILENATITLERGENA